MFFFLFPKNAKALPDLIVNELSFNPIDETAWVEIYNPSGSEVDLSGWKLNNANTMIGGPILTIASGTKISPNGYLVFYRGSSGSNKFWFDITWQGASVTLFKPDNSVMSTLTYSGSTGTNKSWGLYPNGTGPVTKLDPSTQGVSNGGEIVTDTTPPDFPGNYGWGQSLPPAGYAGDGVGISNFKFCGDYMQNEGSYRGVWAEASDTSDVTKYQRQVVKNDILLGQVDEFINYTSEFTGGSVGDGVFYNRLRAIDTLGNATISDSEWSDTSTYSSWCKLTIDTVSPTNLTKVTSTPNIGEYTNGTVQLSWLPVGGDGGSVDNGSGVYGYSFSLDTSSSTIPDETVSSVENGLPQGVFYIQPNGQYYFHIRTVDRAGNWSDTLHTGPLGVDKTNPSADSIFGGTGPSFTGFKVKFSEDVNQSEAEDGANYYLTNWPGAGGSGDLVGDVTIAYDPSTYEATVTFTNAGWYISPEQLWGVTGVHDLAGNLLNPDPTEKTSTSMENPNVTISYPSHGSTYSESDWSGSIYGTATDPNNGSGVARVEVKIGNGSWLPATGTTSWEYSYTPSEGGDITIKSRAYDNAGNVSSEEYVTISYTVDQTPPPIPNLVSPANGSATKPQNALFDWEDVTDDNSPVYYYFRLGEEEAIYTGYDSEYDGSNLLEGDYSWQVKACDHLDNCSDWSAYSSVTLDGTAPTTTDSGTDSDWHNSNVTVTLSCADNVSCANTYYTTNGSDPTTESSTGNTVTLSVDGVYTIKYFSIDTAGNEESIKTAANTVKIDKTKPTNVTTSDSGMWATNKKLSFSWSTPTETLSGIAYYKFYLSTGQSHTSPAPIINGTNIGNVNSYTLSDAETLLLTSGQTYYAKVRAVDNAGNYQTSGGNWSDGITLDLSIPSSTPLTPEAGYYNERSWNGTITGTASDTVSGLYRVEVKVKVELLSGETKYWDGDGFDGDSNSWLVATGTSNWQYSITPIEGSYTIYSRAFDNAGNVESTGVLTGIVYDITIPQVSLTIDPNSPDGENSWYVTEPKITLTANDNYEIEKIEYQLNSQSGVWQTYTASVEVADETTKFYYRATDKAGNVSSVGLKNIKVDTQNPKSIDSLGAEALDSLVSLAWDESSSDDVDHYKIYRSTNRNFIPNPETEIDEVTSGNTDYDDDSVENGTKYYYYILAFDEAGNYSDAVGISATPATTEAEAEVGEVVNLPIPEGAVLGIEEETETPPVINTPNTPNLPNNPEVSSSPEVLGEQATKGENEKAPSYWWVFGLLGLIGLLAFFLIKGKNKKGA